MFISRLPQLIFSTVTTLIALTCVTASASVPNPTITPFHSDTEENTRPFISAMIDLESYGYLEQEFAISGTGNSYDKDGTWKSDGQWRKTLAQSHIPYKTRMLVRRPENPEDFNGVVIVEWLNNTAFMDVDVIWTQSHKEIIRSGYAWVGVTVQSLGVGFLRAWDKQRYGDFTQRNDALSYEIFSQAGKAIREQNQLILGGMEAETLLGVGESQSAVRLTTYINAFQEEAREVYDGMLVYSRFPLSSPLKNGIAMLAPSKVHIREDNTLKVIQLLTEQDVFMFQFRLARQADNESLRTWEIPGASHYDNYGVSKLLPQYQREFPALSELQVTCKNSTNLMPQRYLVNTALDSLHNWVENGIAPPQAEPIEYRFFRVVRDQHGNARGGVRLPDIEVPVARHNYANYGWFGPGSYFVANAFACLFLGNTVPFSQDKLLQLYPSHENYVEQYTDAAKAALEAGFLLPLDYEEAVANAQQAPIP